MDKFDKVVVQESETTQPTVGHSDVDVCPLLVDDRFSQRMYEGGGPI
ncbi:uncharacterized protein METZ01_LOCUS393215 [marine metagenome]|uniref:Uncharacterized protein n=1 Tax=marine metagenome TaxID=408172 RepID=A0A382V3B0_9ZZZZ